MKAVGTNELMLAMIIMYPCMFLGQSILSKYMFGLVLVIPRDATN